MKQKSPTSLVVRLMKFLMSKVIHQKILGLPTLQFLSEPAMCNRVRERKHQKTAPRLQIEKLFTSKSMTPPFKSCFE